MRALGRRIRRRRRLRDGLLRLTLLWLRRFRGRDWPGAGCWVVDSEAENLRDDSFPRTHRSRIWCPIN